MKTTLTMVRLPDLADGRRVRHFIDAAGKLAGVATLPPPESPEVIALRHSVAAVLIARSEDRAEVQAAEAA